MRKYTSGWMALMAMFVLLGACTTPEAPEFKRIENLKIDLVDQNTAKINADVVFFNPNGRKLEIKNVDAAISVEDKQVAALNREYDIVAAANADFAVPLDLELPLKELNMDLLSTAFSMLRGETKKVRYQGKVRVKAYGFSFNVPFDQEQEVKIKL
jgi:LEA14-like dessication related protein